MSYRIKSFVGRDPDGQSSQVDSSEEEDLNDDDENWDDWVSDSLVQPPCKSLFDDTSFPSVEETLRYDETTHDFNLDRLCSKISLDIHGRIRLINYIRKNKISPADAQNLSGKETFFLSDEYLIPVIESDALLQVQPDWSESEDEVSENIDSDRKILLLQKQLAASKQELIEYRRLVTRGIDRENLLEVIDGTEPAEDSKGEDDDGHYFRSYAENEIHAVMIQDRVRTSTYASSILTNPALFRDAIVLDVGCGTGILSMFAAQAGARHVFAVDASDISERAKRIIKANCLEDIITVIEGKVEEINLPEGIDKVDIIISEWMGYALLYESMLDSVLCARDRFLKPGGVLAPSQCKMNLALCDAAEVSKERIESWSDVYGFDMSIMAEGAYGEAMIDVVGPEALFSEPFVIKDLLIKDVTARQLDFTSEFTLTSTAVKRSKVNAFILYFDVFFDPTGQAVPENFQAHIVKEALVADLWPVGGKPAPKRRQSIGKEKGEIASFTTGPHSLPTHWKQTLFMLRDPIPVVEGTVVTGTFHCRKSQTNSRELDVEIHYRVQEAGEYQSNTVIVQLFKVR
ncbi:hypothetical protein M378DRAFT_975790 [Amanita muscaria Koide BX008]|uniref:type I protein arginine methyltransferase n=1 Tax=Amanita muscaria (strain Koide BX008) TaxID=946122 RepID=A0A0C2X0Y4_AMAMK|nr:hypothetical protein M378DRAFT_975790 [Amanita muscaria Koide BX008]